MRRVTRTIAAAGAAIVCCVTMTACSSPFGLPISGSVQTLAPVEQQTSVFTPILRGLRTMHSRKPLSKGSMTLCLLACSPMAIAWLANS